jgi:hypothetical protein
MPNAEWRCARSIPARWYVRLREDGPWRRVRVVVDLPLVRAVDLRYVGGGYDVLPYELADAIRASRTTGLAYALTADGFRPLAHDVDPFAGAPMADDDPWTGEQLRRAHARFVRCKVRGWTAEPWAAEGERQYQRLRMRQRRARQSAADSSTRSTHVPTPILTTPTGSPMLVSLTGQGEPGRPDPPAQPGDTLTAPENDCQSERGQWSA